MAAGRHSRASTFLTYVIYGVATCAVVLVPWVALEALVERVPWIGTAKERLGQSGLPVAVEAVLDGQRAEVQALIERARIPRPGRVPGLRDRVSRALAILREKQS